jgi:undecaprenyl-diphosphatase
MNAWIENSVLGLLQGLTEFLPISSSGHLRASKEVLGCEAGLALDVALHVATLAAVVVYFRGDLAALLRHPRRIHIGLVVAIATVPGALLGALLSSWRERIDPWWVVGGWAFSAAYLSLSRGRGGTGSYAHLKAVKGLLIGCAQALAIFPGVSRSGSTIVSGLWLGLERGQAFRFSFLLAIPLIAGAGIKQGFDLHQSGFGSVGGAGPLALGMAIAFAAGLASIRWLLGLVRRDCLYLFGGYNLAAAAAFALFLILKS